MRANADTDLASVLQALAAQQAALLQVQGESVRLQRLILEHVLGPAPPPATAAERAIVPDSAAVAVELTVGPAPAAPSSWLPARVSAEALPDLAPEPASTSGEPTSRAALYYQQRPARGGAPARVRPQDLDLLRRLHELGDASSLILQFGPHKGSTLAQVALRDPDYVRQLANRAERPAVRAAAGRLVEALEAAAEHAPRAAAGRRNR
jgi:hypothetical protein